MRISLGLNPMGFIGLLQINVSVLASIQLAGRCLIHLCALVPAQELYLMGTGAQTLPQKLSQESVTLSHSDQCSGLHQNSKISRCVTPHATSHKKTKQSDKQ